METGWRKRLQKLIDESEGLTMKSLSLRAGLGPGAVHDVLKRGMTPSVENFIAIAEAAGVEPGWLLRGDDRFAIQIPLVGRVTGETWEETEAKLGAVPFDLEEPGAIGFEVQDGSMAPVYRPGDLLVCHRKAGKYVENLIGTDCVVRTVNGDGYVKILQRGSRIGRYNLRSYNPLFKDIEDVVIEWAAPIAWIKRGAV